MNKLGFDAGLEGVTTESCDVVGIEGLRRDGLIGPKLRWRIPCQGIRLQLASSFHAESCFSEGDDSHNSTSSCSADRSIDDGRDDATTDVDAEPRKQPTADQSADDTDDDVADEAEATASHDLAGKPARNGTDDEPNDESLSVNGHAFRSPVWPQHLQQSPQQPLHAAALLFRRLQATASYRAGHSLTSSTAVIGRITHACCVASLRSRALQCERMAALHSRSLPTAGNSPRLDFAGASAGCRHPSHTCNTLRRERYPCREYSKASACLISAAISPAPIVRRCWPSRAPR